MAKLALAVIGMPRHMMCMLVMVLVPTATLIVIMLFMLMMMMLVTAATLIVMMLMLLVCSVVIATAAVIVLLCCMLMRMAAAITMAMLRDMPHAGMIVVLATVTTGAAFGMVTIIFIPLNMAVHMSKAAHLTRRIAYIF